MKYFITGILKQDRVALAQAITLVESNLPADQEMAGQLLEQIISNTGNSIRIGITGPPGVGKSTFLEAFGKHIINSGKRLAVLTIDPSSPLTKGSILGDKTRMEDLARDPRAFIRPSASGSALGGVAYKTREAILLCEAAGFDVIAVETVGVGQSEVAVKNMVDFFLLLMLAGAGDELQGIKKGIMEMADGIVITKADGDNINKTREAQAEYQHALHLLNPHASGWTPAVLTASALQEIGIDKVWKMIMRFYSHGQANSAFNTNRRHQNTIWFEEYFQFLLRNELEHSIPLQQLAESLKGKVQNQELPANVAAKQLLRKFREFIQGNIS